MTSVDLFEKESFFDVLKKSVSKHLQINRILLIVYAVLSGFLFLGALRPAAEGSDANSGITLFVWLFSLIFSARVFFKPEALPETDAPHAVQQDRHKICLAADRSPGFHCRRAERAYRDNKADVFRHAQRRNRFARRGDLRRIYDAYRRRARADDAF